MGKLWIGISSCLLGEKVRWNGDHKQNLYAKEILGKFFDYVPVCPEVEIGMGVPRETVHLAGDKDSPRMVGTKTGTDWTQKMIRFSAGKVRELSSHDLSGFIFKKGSPSCGIERVSLYTESGNKANSMAQGLFASTFMKKFPLIPVEEEGRLNDFKIRENFIVRVFSYHRLQKLFQEGYSRGALVNFHTQHKFLLLSHSRKHYDTLGGLVAEAKKFRPAEMKTRYSKIFMEGLTLKSTPKKNTDVLQHMLGFLKKDLLKEEKQDILSTLEDYRKELVPLIVPLTLIKHYVKKYDITYLLDQVYLNPYPKELMLRNHV
ncbi:MAG: DUF523 and DUF1722 domain-containing protein [Nitrospinae bacterium]|jgi:uncharacterized protein YbgA (DUF1722 family)/uncharacterized protein YbbK (DUF523 family)|nr:DUF523 and DUF1722 domain-containing protein [Nitrospinota bacterium]MDA1109104.1 DUF523 and DUF1722 domain-containing protein [Nitrospinota bacterium]